MPRIIGWTPLWSKDKKTLVQIFTNLETGLIELATVNTRRDKSGPWEPSIEVEKSNS